MQEVDRLLEWLIIGADFGVFATYLNQYFTLPISGKTTHNLYTV